LCLCLLIISLQVIQKLLALGKQRREAEEKTEEEARKVR
jgi:hypothetical protein